MLPDIAALLPGAGFRPACEREETLNLFVARGWVTLRTGAWQPGRGGAAGGGRCGGARSDPASQPCLSDSTSAAAAAAIATARARAAAMRQSRQLQRQCRRRHPRDATHSKTWSAHSRKTYPTRLSALPPRSAYRGGSSTMSACSSWRRTGSTSAWTAGRSRRGGTHWRDLGMRTSGPASTRAASRAGSAPWTLCGTLRGRRKRGRASTGFWRYVPIIHSSGPGICLAE